MILTLQQAAARRRYRRAGRLRLPVACFFALAFPVSAAAEVQPGWYGTLSYSNSVHQVPAGSFDLEQQATYTFDGTLRPATVPGPPRWEQVVGWAGSHVFSSTSGTCDDGTPETISSEGEGAGTGGRGIVQFFESAGQWTYSVDASAFQSQGATPPMPLRTTFPCGQGVSESTTSAAQAPPISDVLREGPDQLTLDGKFPLSPGPDDAQRWQWHLTRDPRRLTVVKVALPEGSTTEDPGTVTSDPLGIACGARCEADFAAAHTVSLTASPEPGWRVESWEGAAETCGPGDLVCAVPMLADRTVRVRFSPIDCDPEFSTETAAAYTADEEAQFTFAVQIPWCHDGARATLRWSAGAVSTDTEWIQDTALSRLLGAFAGISFEVNSQDAEVSAESQPGGALQVVAIGDVDACLDLDQLLVEWLSGGAGALLKAKKWAKLTPHEQAALIARIDDYIKLPKAFEAHDVLLVGLLATALQQQAGSWIGGEVDLGSVCVDTWKPRITATLMPDGQASFAIDTVGGSDYWLTTNTSL